MNSGQIEIGGRPMERRGFRILYKLELLEGHSFCRERSFYPKLHCLFFYRIATNTRTILPYFIPCIVKDIFRISKTLSVYRKFYWNNNCLLRLCMAQRDALWQIFVLSFLISCYWLEKHERLYLSSFKTIQTVLIVLNIH